MSTVKINTILDDIGKPYSKDKLDKEIVGSIISSVRVYLETYTYENGQYVTSHTGILRLIKSLEANLNDRDLEYVVRFEFIKLQLCSQIQKTYTLEDFLDMDLMEDMFKNFMFLYKDGKIRTQHPKSSEDVVGVYGIHGYILNNIEEYDKIGLILWRSAFIDYIDLKYTIDYRLVYMDELKYGHPLRICEKLNHYLPLELRRCYKFKWDVSRVVLQDISSPYKPIIVHNPLNDDCAYDWRRLYIYGNLLQKLVAAFKHNPQSIEMHPQDVQNYHNTRFDIFDMSDADMATVTVNGSLVEAIKNSSMGQKLSELSHSEIEKYIGHNIRTFKYRGVLV